MLVAAASASLAIAHAAGPIVAIYLPGAADVEGGVRRLERDLLHRQQPDRVPPYVAAGLITTETLRHDLRYPPMPPPRRRCRRAINRMLLPQRVSMSSSR
jgi:hypothetical protein